jgi:hypothetical protein
MRKQERNTEMLNVKMNRRFRVTIEYDLTGPPGVEVDKWRAIIPSREATDVSFAIAEWRPAWRTYERDTASGPYEVRKLPVRD